jgi:hypothetical protein
VPIEFTYHFHFEDQDIADLEFAVALDEKTVNYIPTAGEHPMEWTKLDFHKCSNCPLNSKDHPDCPVALNLGRFVDAFKDMKSFWKAQVTVETPERKIVKDTDLQTGMFSVFGLIMATSGCPHMDFLKPMARFHLPFSNMDETMIRSTAFSLLKQYFNVKNGQKADIELENLDDLYEEVNTVNAGIIGRIRNIGAGDSKANAVLILEAFASMLAMEIESDMTSISEFFS